MDRWIVTRHMMPRSLKYESKQIKSTRERNEIEHTDADLLHFHHSPLISKTKTLHDGTLAYVGYQVGSHLMLTVRGK